MVLGRNRESRRREAAGRRNYPEAVPKESSGGNGTREQALGHLRRVVRKTIVGESQQRQKQHA